MMHMTKKSFQCLQTLSHFNVGFGLGMTLLYIYNLWEGMPTSVGYFFFVLTHHFTGKLKKI